MLKANEVHIKLMDDAEPSFWCKEEKKSTTHHITLSSFVCQENRIEIRQEGVWLSNSRVNSLTLTSLRVHLSSTS